VLERKSGEALWRQIGERIADEITSKGLRPGARLPTEPELAQRFAVSRNTVRRAMSMLEDDGVVRIEQGRGTFVHEGVIHYEISKRTRYSENLARQGIDPGRQIRQVVEVPAPPAVAEALAIAAGDSVVLVESISLADGAAVSLGRSYYPAARFPGLAGKWTAGDATSSALLATYGVVDYTRLRTSITTRPPTDAEARALHQPRSRWVLVTQKVDVDETGKPVCFSETTWAGDRVQFVVESD
jgi:GntR family phosphonate transport system transcriptional regulator